MMNKNITIGFLIPDLEEPIGAFYLKSVYDYASKNGIKLITLSCGRFFSSVHDEHKKNMLFDLIDNKLFDGFLVWSSLIFQNASKEEAEKIISKLAPKPVVCIQLGLNNLPTVLLDNYKGMKKVITHLIKDHGIRKIAFLRGPEKHVAAMSRFKAYLDTLEENNIPIEERLISEPGRWFDTGRPFVSQLIEVNSLKPAEHFNAIVCSSTNLAKEVITELKFRNYKVPYDVVVTGIDDFGAKYYSPGITNSHFDYYNVGKIAIDMLTKIINDDFIQSEVLIEPDLAIRGSCGCIDENLKDYLTFDDDHIEELSGENDKVFNKNLIVTKVINTLNYSKINSRFLEKLLLTVIDHFEDTVNINIIHEIDDILGELILLNTDEVTIKKAIYILSEELLPYMKDRTKIIGLMTICEQIMVILFQKNQRALNYQNFLQSQKTEITNITGQKLINTYELKDLIKILTSEIVKCGINWLNLYLYENPEKPKDKVRLIAAFDGTKNVTAEYKEDVIPTVMVFSKMFLPEQNFFNVAVNNLYYKDENIGLLVFGIKDMNFLKYNILINQIASSLKGKKLLKELEVSNDLIIKRSHDIESLVVPMLDSIKSIAAASEDKMLKMINLKVITDSGHKKMKLTKTYIETIYSNINKMRELINIIDGISASVKILAINASITSNQAGEHGKSFAIIAKEIRKLSENTKNEANQIYDILTKLIQETIISKKNCNEAFFGFTDIKKGVNEIVDYLSEVSSRMKELDYTSNTILNLMNIKS